MKKILRPLLTVVVIVLATTNSLSQSDYERQLEQFAADLVKKIPGGNKKVAVIDFRNNDDQITQFTKQFADDLSLELAMLSGTGNFQVVERHKMAALVKDMKRSDRRNEDSVMLELSRKSIAKIFLSGTVTSFGDNYRITIKVLNDDGDLISASKGLVVKTTALDLLHRKVLEDFRNDRASHTLDDGLSKQDESRKSNTGPQRTTASSTKGWIDFTNKTRYSLKVWTSQDPALHQLRAKVFELTTVESGETKSLPSLEAGDYYICAIWDTYSQSCNYAQKVVVTANKGTPVVFNQQ